jgi:DNA replication protein DnaC
MGGMGNYLVERYVPSTRTASTPPRSCWARRRSGEASSITSNLVFGEWDRIFKNPMTTAAAIDRRVHRSAILEFNGRSKRADEAETRGKSSAPSPEPRP